MPHISKTINTFIDNVEDLEIVMPMYNLLDYSDNYYMTSGSLRNYYRDEVNDDTNENNYPGNYRINNNKTTASKSFGFKTKTVKITPADGNILVTEVAAPFKYLSNF